jgi:hypothetical protein
MSRKTTPLFVSLRLFASVCLFVSLCLLATAAPAAGQQATRSAPRRAGEALCVLGPNDFAQAGVGNASKPSANVQDGGASAYCVYAGKSSATGGIELDVFSPAGTSPAEIKATYQTAIGESSTAMTPIRIEGADEARWSAHAVSGGPPFATIAVRRGDLVFVLGIPANKDAQAQLTSLSGLVLKRF